ncbi:hypothetical protein NGM36_26070 [Streptomyces mutabilis]|uniref:hypothetical protein n=1 Tax=Streptomyces mutabilis TaxID=67332 RepID=UPI0022BA1F02|nr:hypothetical protein [Streptomyces mutabilis]MCZ9353193.1 hypothetical protein [Streptomyces mutabilis]
MSRFADAAARLGRRAWRIETAGAPADSAATAARTRHAAEPTAERPSGAVIATTEPEIRQGQPVRVIGLGP